MNHLDEIKVLLESLHRRCPANGVLQTIVVDNCSTDGTAEFIREYYPSVEIIVNSSAHGFAQNNNIGIGKSRGQYLLFLNPDIEVLDGSIDALLAFIQANPGVGIAGPMLFNRDGSIQPSARRFVALRTVFERALLWGRDVPITKHLGNYLMCGLSTERPSPVDWVTGAAMMVRRSAIQDVGKMDEHFFLYIEDQDWCFRMWQGGWEVYYVPQSRMIHGHRRESVRGGLNRKSVWHARSLLYFLWKHRIFLRDVNARTQASPVHN